MKIFFIFFENLLCFPLVNFFCFFVSPILVSGVQNSCVVLILLQHGLLQNTLLGTYQNLTRHTSKHYQTHTKTLLHQHQNITRHTPEHYQTHTKTLLDSHQNITRLSPEHYQTHARTLLDTHHNIIRHTPEHY